MFGIDRYISPENRGGDLHTLDHVVVPDGAQRNRFTPDQIEANISTLTTRLGWSEGRAAEEQRAHNNLEDKVARLKAEGKEGKAIRRFENTLASQHRLFETAGISTSE